MPTTCQPRRRFAVAVTLLMGMLCSAASAQCFIPPERDAWARFQPGAWKQVRLEKKIYDAAGELTSTSVTETKITLVRVDRAGYTLKVESVVEVAGRQFPVEASEIRRSFRQADARDVAEQGVRVLTIDGTKVTAASRRIVEREGPVTRVSEILVSDDVAPYVLERTTKNQNADGDDTGETTHVQVVSLAKEKEVLTDTRTASEIKSVQQFSEGQRETLETHCADIPGGLVTSESLLVDAQGKVIARSTLSLVDYSSVQRQRERVRRIFFPRFRVNRW